jgi:hypothetical protein
MSDDLLEQQLWLESMLLEKSLEPSLFQCFTRIEIVGKNQAEAQILHFWRAQVQLRSLLFIRR